ncbi:MAG: hypothetical protein SGARI_004554 [Bacillariaceae sp.]
MKFLAVPICVLLLVCNTVVEAGTLRGGQAISMATKEQEGEQRDLRKKKKSSSSSEDAVEDAVEDVVVDEPPRLLLRMGCDDVFNTSTGNAPAVEFAVQPSRVAQVLRRGTNAVITLGCNGNSEFFDFVQGPFFQNTQFTLDIPVPDVCRGVISIRTSCPLD